MQRRFLFVFFGKLIEAIVILRGSIYQSRVRLLDAGLAQFRSHARSILPYIAREFD